MHDSSLFSSVSQYPLPLSISTWLSPGKDKLLRTVPRLVLSKSLPFLEGFLLGALWAAGVREKVGSVLSKKETASWRKGGEMGRGSKRSLGTKQPRAHSTSVLSQSGVWEGICSLGLGGFIVSLLESFEPGRLSLMHCVPLLIYFIPVKLRDKEGGCWLLEAFYFPPGPSGPHAVCHSSFRLP